MHEDFLKGKWFDEIVIHARGDDFLMGFLVQAHMGKQQDIGFRAGVLNLPDDIEGDGSLQDVFGNEGGKMVMVDLINGLLSTPRSMDIVSPFLEKRL